MKKLNLRNKIEKLLEQWRFAIRAHRKLAGVGCRNSKDYADMLQACVNELQEVLGTTK